MKRKYLLVLDDDVVTKIDQRVIRPCSRSDTINDALVYLLQTPYIFEDIIKRRNEDMLSIAMRDIPSE